MIKKLNLDSPTGVQSAVSEVNMQVAQAETLMQSQDPASETYASLGSIKTMMQSLASALEQYLNLLLAGRRYRKKRQSGILLILFDQ